MKFLQHWERNESHRPQSLKNKDKKPTTNTYTEEIFIEEKKKLRIQSTFAYNEVEIINFTLLYNYTCKSTRDASCAHTRVLLCWKVCHNLHFNFSKDLN